MVNLSPRKPSMPRGPLPGGLGLMEITSNDGFFGDSVWDSNGMTPNAKAVQDNTYSVIRVVFTDAGVNKLHDLTAAQPILSRADGLENFREVKRQNGVQAHV